MGRHKRVVTATRLWRIPFYRHGTACYAMEKERAAISWMPGMRRWRRARPPSRPLSRKPLTPSVEAIIGIGAKRRGPVW